jgi:hypothetical protein
MMDHSEREQLVNAYVSRKLAELAEERDGDLRVIAAGLVNSEVTFDIREFQSGEWKLTNENVTRRVVNQLTAGHFICRNQNMGYIVGDYRRRESVVLLRIPCVQCAREYTFPKRGPSQLAVNGYCSIPCAVVAGVALDEAVRQAKTRMVYIGE